MQRNCVVFGAGRSAVGSDPTAGLCAPDAATTLAATSDPNCSEKRFQNPCSGATGYSGQLACPCFPWKAAPAASCQRHSARLMKDSAHLRPRALVNLLAIEDVAAVRVSGVLAG